MSRGMEAHREFAILPVRRFCLRVVNSNARAAQWAVFEENTERLLQRIQAQVSAYLQGLVDLGALADPRFIVECRASQRADQDEIGIAILLVFRPTGSDDAITLTLHLSDSGCRVGSTAFAPGIENCA